MSIGRAVAEGLWGGGRRSDRVLQRALRRRLDLGAAAVSLLLVLGANERTDPRLLRAKPLKHIA
ncbi:hypothetical protein AJ87_35285 [Rhizobium yanglingense]|nr:hypothetical protein AJ87_35285 [Rhizobium yanglingense]